MSRPERLGREGRPVCQPLPGDAQCGKTGLVRRDDLGSPYSGARGNGGKRGRSVDASVIT